MRDAPSLAIVTALEDAGAQVRAHDPASIEQARPLMPNVTFFDDPYACAQGAHALVIVTEWDPFRALDFARLKETMAAPTIVDLRNVYRAEDVRRRGFRYVGVGVA
jgi:UDPglucose 6-dehydrogenase